MAGDDVELRQDEDVLDTWFSSALWPFSTLGWPEQTTELETLLSDQVLVTGFDIIFFWVARMIMMGLEFMGDVPFRKVYIHGLIRDQDGQKMSKSKGNVLDPIWTSSTASSCSMTAGRQTHDRHDAAAPREESIEKATRKQFPDGISRTSARTRCASPSRRSRPTGRDIRFDLAASRATATSATSSGTRPATC